MRGGPLTCPLCEGEDLGVRAWGVGVGRLVMAKGQVVDGGGEACRGVWT